MKYQDWIKSLAEDTLKRALKTADKILADADKTYLDSTDLSKLHDSWEVITCTNNILKEEPNVNNNVNFNESGTVYAN